MASKKIKGIEIAISADTKGVTRGLKEVNEQSFKTGKNLKTVESLLKFDPKDTTLLAEKQKLLGNSINETKEKLKMLKAAQADVKAEFKKGNIGESEYLAFQGELVKTKDKLESLKKEAKESNTVLNSMKGAVSSAGNKLGTGLKVGAEIAVASIAAVGAAVVATTKAMADFTKAGAEYADSILTESTVTGIATDKLQKYHYAAELVDVSTETLTGAMAKNIKSMTAVKNGSEAMTEAYKELGVRATDVDGNLRDSEQVFWELIDNLGSVEDETQRDALAMQIFGKSAQELNPLIEAGSLRMKELGEQAEEAGAVMSDDVLQEFGSFDDELQKLKVNGQAAQRSLGTVLLPALIKLGTTGNDMLTKFTKGMNDAESMEDMGNVVGDFIMELVNGIVDNLPGILEMGAGIVETLVMAIIDNIPLILNTGAELLMMLMNGMTEAFPSLIPQIIDVLLTIIETMVDNIDMMIDASIALITAISDGLITAMPILIERVPEIIVKLIEAIIRNLPKVLKAAWEIVKALVKGIIDNLPEIEEGGKKIIGAVWDGLKGIFTKATSWGKDMIQGIIDGIKGKISDVKDAVAGVADTIKSYLHFSVPDVGPLTDYQTWMPDFMKGLASGIEKNKRLVTDAMQNLAQGMSINPAVNVSGISSGSGALPIAGGNNIVINLNASISSDMDIRNVAEKLGYAMQDIANSNTVLKGGAT